MKLKRLIGVILIVLGVLGLVYGGFSYTEETRGVDLGPVEFEIADKERVDVPEWLAVATIAGGVLLLLHGRRR